jgi:hypothetical protein
MKRPTATDTGRQGNRVNGRRPSGSAVRPAGELGMSPGDCVADQKFVRCKSKMPIEQQIARSDSHSFLHPIALHRTLPGLVIGPVLRQILGRTAVHPGERREYFKERCRGPSI